MKKTKGQVQPRRKSSLLVGFSEPNREQKNDEATPYTRASFAMLIETALARRQRIKLFDDEDKATQDLAPKFVRDKELNNEFSKLNDTICSDNQEEVQVQKAAFRRSTIGGLKVNIEDVIQLINTSTLKIRDQSIKVQDIFDTEKASEGDKKPVHLKVILQITDDILLYEQRSSTVLKRTEEAKLVEEDNKKYEYLTVGRGRIRRTADAETQTKAILYKSRDVNTSSVQKADIGTFVSNYDMFDTYKNMEKSINVVNEVDVATYKARDINNITDIIRLPSFQLAAMLTKRLLAGNVFSEQQRRFRNMYYPNPLALEVAYKYQAKELWQFGRHKGSQRHAISDISWCHSNGDIVAVAYGIYLLTISSIPHNGLVCVWNIKNPVNPERSYDYNIPVVALEFSQFVPQLIAIGLYDGTVEVRDITNEDDPPIAVSLRASSAGCEPITQIRWIKQTTGDNLELDPFLAVAQDGIVTKYRIVNSPYLVSFQQMKLDSVEGTPEGLTVKRNRDTLESNRHPQGLSITLHPTKFDIYYILTNEGCLHKCSINHSHQHLELWQAHEGAVFSMEFSPWSPKLFLTCGNDWCIRIWLEGIFQPLITLINEIGPVHCAKWSKTHSTIIMATNRKTLDIWDIRRSTLKPVSSTIFSKSYLTMAQFSNCGRSVAVGNQRGLIFLCAFEDMPFPPHFQYEELEQAILKRIADNNELSSQVKSVGYYGYERKRKAI